MSFPASIAIWLLAAAALAGGCNSGQDGSGSCDEVGKHFAELARAEAEALADDHPAKEKAEAQLATLPKVRATLVAECENEKWSVEVRDCFIGAEDAKAFRKDCEKLIDRLEPKAEPGSDEDQDQAE